MSVRAQHFRHIHRLLHRIYEQKRQHMEQQSMEQQQSKSLVMVLLPRAEFAFRTIDQQVKHVSLISPELRLKHIQHERMRSRSGLPTQVPRNLLRLVATYNLPFSIPIYDQGNTGSCTANALASAYRLRSTKNFAPSRLWIYYYGRLLSGDHRTDNGAYPFYVLRSMDRNRGGVGCTTEVCWPFNVRRINTRPSLTGTCTRVPRGYITGWSDNWSPGMSDSTLLLNLKTALSQNFPIYIGINVYYSFFNTGSDGVVPEPTNNEALAGGHMLLLVGYDDTKTKNGVTGYFKFVNSWGNRWGQNGFGYMSYQFLLHPMTQADSLQSIRTVI